MTIYVKNITTVAVPIINLNITVYVGDVRKVIGDLDTDYVEAKNELDILIDDKKIELINDLGQLVTSSEVFGDVIDLSTEAKKLEEVQTEDMNQERFYYVEDIFCISKGGSIIKSFKGYTDTLRLSVKNKSIKYRIKSQGVCMPWQYLKLDKENTLNFEYRLKDPSIEILSDAGDCSVNMYIDGYVTGITANDLQNFIDTWYENQSYCPDNNEWYGENIWWNDNKITNGDWVDWIWSEKIGSFVSKTINDYSLNVDTLIVQQNDGAKLVIPDDKIVVNGFTTQEFKIFKHAELSEYTIEYIEYNDWADWNPNKFTITVRNIRFIEFNGQSFELANMTLTDWDDRWTEPHYYANTGLKFVSTSGSFQSAIGSYTVDTNGKPDTVTLITANQATLTDGEPLSTLTSGEYDFFIIANGATDILDTSIISFDNTRDYPSLLIDGVASTYPVFFSDPALNYDGKDHFIYSPDGNGGTNIYIEDLPGLGDEDFDDIVLNVNFPMTDKILIHTPDKIEDLLRLGGTSCNVAISTNMRGIAMYAMGEIKDDNNKGQVWRLRNGSDSDLNVKFYNYKTKQTEYFTIPANTDLYKRTEETKYAKMYWYTGSRLRYTKKTKSKHDFKSDINLKNETLKTITGITSSIFSSWEINYGKRK